MFVKRGLIKIRLLNMQVVCIVSRLQFNILTTLTRDIQCEKFIEDESVSHEPCDSRSFNVS